MTAPKIIFMGTPEVSCITFEKLIASGTYAPKLVITQPDKPAGRGQKVSPPPVKVLAEKHNIEVWQPDKLKEEKVIDRIKAWQPDIIIVAAYGKLIPLEILRIPPHGIVNIHPSLLPRWRGPSPVQYTLLMGDEQAGVTVMSVDEHMDSGDILAQQQYPIGKDDTAQTLMYKLFECGSDLLLTILPDIVRGNLEPVRQNHANATFSKLFAREDGEIKPECTREQAIRMVRAFTPWPSAFILLDGKMLKLIKARETQCDEGLPALSLSLSKDKELILHMADGCLALETVQFEGKKQMNGYDFYLGYANRR